MSGARPSLDHTMMDLARAWSRRGTCNRLRVGAVIARDGRALSAGYNGPASGEPHCIHANTVGTPEEVGCTAAIHAEVNAIVNAAVDGTSVRGAALYTTHTPCVACAGLILNARIGAVFFDEYYRSHEGLYRLEARGVYVEKLI